MKKAYGWIVALVLLTFVVTGIFLTVAPDQIPVHYILHIIGNLMHIGLTAGITAECGVIRIP